jgi:5-methylcytosine-specific restriction endonuclease McrA
MISAIKDKLLGKVPNGIKRSSKWPGVRRKFLKENSSCAVCGSSKKLEVHHIIPFHEDRLKEFKGIKLPFSNRSFWKL